MSSSDYFCEAIYNAYRGFFIHRTRTKFFCRNFCINAMPKKNLNVEINLKVRLEVLKKITLNHEVFNDPVELASGIPIAINTSGKLNKVFNSLGYSLSKETNNYSACIFISNFYIKVYFFGYCQISTLKVRKWDPIVFIIYNVSIFNYVILCVNLQLW